MRIKGLYRPEILTVTTGETLAAVARRMERQRVGALAVLDEGKLAGIVTERDLVRAIADGADPFRTLVAPYITAEPASADPEEEADHVARRMLNLGVRHLPVVAGGKVVGMVSMRDLLVLEAWQPGELASS